jgi:hypothetical protein
VVVEEFIVEGGCGRGGRGFGFNMEVGVGVNLEVVCWMLLLAVVIPNLKFTIASMNLLNRLFSVKKP